jgi:hypothetical protein
MIQLKGEQVRKSLFAAVSNYAAITIAIAAAAFAQPQSQNSLHSAAENGNIDQVKSILAEAKDVNARDQRGRTPLIAAASKGQYQVMQFLIESKADINIQDNSGATALHQAASGGYVPAVRLLLSSGADATLRTQSGLTAQQIAQNSQNTELVSEFQSHIAPGQPQIQIANYQGTTEQEQTWKAAVAAATSDPCQLTARIAAQGLKPAVDSLARLGQNERRAWEMRTAGQRTRLCSVVQQQIRAELRFVEEIARQEGAQKVASDANSLQVLWDQRIHLVSERLREVRRQEMAQAAGRTLPPARPANSRQTQPATTATATDANSAGNYFSPSRTAAQQERLAGVWATGSTDNSVDQLLTDFNDLVTTDLGYLRTSALAAKAPAKTSTAVDAVILLRSDRYSTVRSEIQAQSTGNAAGPGAMGPGMAPLQQPGRRGAVMQPGQQQGTGYNRGTRRGR